MVCFPQYTGVGGILLLTEEPDCPAVQDDCKNALVNVGDDLVHPHDLLFFSIRSC